jgi:hypothetical protein
LKLVESSLLKDNNVTYVWRSLLTELSIRFFINIELSGLVKLAKEVDSNGGNAKTVTGPIKKTNAAGFMKFTLSPVSATPQISTSSDLVSNTGGIHTAISWSPNPLAPYTQSKLRISFYDPTGIEPLTNTNVRYNLIIFDKHNHALITKQNLLAKNATDTENCFSS